MRVPVRNKLFAAFGVVVAIAAVQGIMSIVQAGAMHDDQVQVSDGAFPAIAAADDMTIAINVYVRHQREHVSAAAADKADVASEMQSDKSDFLAAAARFASLSTTASDRAALAQVRTLFERYVRDSSSVVPLSVAGEAGKAHAVLDRTDATFSALEDRLSKIAVAEDRRAAAATRSASASYSHAKTLTYVFLALAILVALGAGYAVARIITRGVRQAVVAAEGIAAGDVDQTVDIRSNDELGDLGGAFQRMLAYLKSMTSSAHRIAAGDLTVEVTPVSERDALGTAFEQMIANLRQMIGDVNRAAFLMGSSSQQMASSSEEAGRAVSQIANAVSDVAKGAERQMKMVDEARASMDETTRAAEQARVVTTEGVAAAETAAAAMHELRESNTQVTGAIRQLASKSEQIGGIVETITGIAAQTNLLALNAAIEAARAGEQGRGFAVVAEEVRKLAEESQSASALIATLVGEIQAETETTVHAVEDGAAKTEESAATVEKARDAFHQIGASVEDMRARIEQIVAATCEVASVAEESSASTEEVSASTEQTSASANEIAASAQQLARTAEELQHVVSRFTITA